MHSYFHVPSGTLLDPMEPIEGLDALGGRPQRIVLTNRHHYRHSAPFAEAFGCPVSCHEAGLHEFDGGVEGLAFGDELAPGVVAHEVGVLCPEETAVQVGDALAFADAIIRGRHGEPISRGGRSALRTFADAPTAGGPPG